jgi:hypothetical protein
MRLGTVCILTTVVLLALDAGPLHAAARQRPGRPRQASCDVATCTVEAALEQACPCGDAATHGQYVRCAAHAVKRLVVDGVISRRCRRRVVALAAHSVCGRADAIVCLLPTSTCGTDGACANDPTVDCVDDTDCGTRCGETSGDRCDSVGGIPLDVGTCVFAGCASPSGAFLDGTRTF